MPAATGVTVMSLVNLRDPRRRCRRPRITSNNRRRRLG